MLAALLFTILTTILLLADCVVFLSIMIPINLFFMFFHGGVVQTRATLLHFWLSTFARTLDRRPRYPSWSCPRIRIYSISSRFKESYCTVL